MIRRRLRELLQQMEELERSERLKIKSSLHKSNKKLRKEIEEAIRNERTAEEISERWANRHNYFGGG